MKITKYVKEKTVAAEDGFTSLLKLRIWIFPPSFFGVEQIFVTSNVQVFNNPILAQLNDDNLCSNIELYAFAKLLKAYAYLNLPSAPL